MKYRQYIKYFKYPKRGKKEILNPSPTQQRLATKPPATGGKQRQPSRHFPAPGQSLQSPVPHPGTHRAQHRTAAAAGARARSYRRTRRRAAPPAPAAAALPLGPRGSRGSRCPLSACSARGKAAPEPLR